MKIEEANKIALEILGSYFKREVTEDELLMPLDNLGADSIDMLSIVYQIEKKFGVIIEIEKFLDQETLQDSILTVVAELDQ